MARNRNRAQTDLFTDAPANQRSQKMARAKRSAAPRRRAATAPAAGNGVAAANYSGRTYGTRGATARVASAEARRTVTGSTRSMTSQRRSATNRLGELNQVRGPLTANQTMQYNRLRGQLERRVGLNNGQKNKIYIKKNAAGNFVKTAH